METNSEFDGFDIDELDDTVELSDIDFESNGRIERLYHSNSGMVNRNFVESTKMIYRNESKIVFISKSRHHRESQTFFVTDGTLERMFVALEKNLKGIADWDGVPTRDGHTNRLYVFFENGLVGEYVCRGRLPGCIETQLIKISEKINELCQRT